MIQQLQTDFACRIEHHQSREEWLAARRTMVGASDTAGIFGVGYASQSPLTIWASKRGIEEPEIPTAQLRRMNIGSKMEPIIAELFSEETGLETFDPGDFTIFRHGEIDWLGATLDRVSEDKGHMVPVELKRVSGILRKDWDADDEPPLKFQVQCQHQMAVVGADWAYLVGLIGDDDLAVRKIERNQKFIDAMEARLAEFWQHVQSGTMPAVDESEATKAMLAHIWPWDSGLTVSLPHDASEWDRELIELKEQQKTLESRRTFLENQIKSALGEAAIGLLPSGGSYSWKTQQRKGYVVEASECRVLRRSK